MDKGYLPLSSDAIATALSGDLNRLGFMWQMYSPGPSKWAGPLWLGQMHSQKDPQNVYDATNGTISIGMIWWTNKGNFDGSKL